jgi:glycosyltransferase involved in cell wall biosynthesis
MGLFVIGSNLGGIAELVDQPWKGRLVAAGDVAAWRSALAEFAAAGAPVRPAVSTMRTMADAAQDMARLYESLAA